VNFNGDCGYGTSNACTVTGADKAPVMSLPNWALQVVVWQPRVNR